MSNLTHVFANGRALIPFITAGDPNLTTTEQLIAQMARAGADLIELGIPFSDSTAADPVVQKAESRAIIGGATLDKIFAMLRRLRQYCNVPIAFMSYLNPIFAYGTTRFMNNCREVAVCAVIVPDLPFEERDELLPDCRANDVSLIAMITLTSRDRIQKIAEQAQGFICCMMPPDAEPAAVQELINEVKRVKQIPCAVNAGCSAGDGVIAGSVIARLIEKYGPHSVPHVTEYVHHLKIALG
ncbi:MAG TPA: tryptophan synthase subunit alpha [Firmicutes bacterium]|nr:tryptophan synthase subunit alpha [Bacillota bacterium]